MTMIYAALCHAARLSTAMILAAGLGGIAQAATTMQEENPGSGQATASRTMRYGDLDLSSEAGRARLETRLKVAAGTVCGKRSLWTVRPPADYERCYDEALSAARLRLERRLTAGEATVRLASN